MVADGLAQFPLWQRTLGASDEFESQRAILRQAFLQFRGRVAQLVQVASAALPDLTVHDIGHLDALWRVADEIAGAEYPLNPAEAFVFGGSVLLHDAAHVFAAYEDGIDGIKRTAAWRDLIAQCFEGVEPRIGSGGERQALFQVMRELHARRARELPFVVWKIPTTGTAMHLLEHLELRNYYGDLIGEIAESHHWPSHVVAERFSGRSLNAPAFLAPVQWSVDPLKVAMLLRTADAAHVDAQRAPWFVFALQQPGLPSEPHWSYQAKLGQPTRTEHGELRLSSGSTFSDTEQSAWWLAYDAAQMIDRELRDAQIHLRDANRRPFAAHSVEHVATPEAFAKNVRPSGWEPVNVQARIGDVERVILSLGGAQLYGDRPEIALRELLQNAIDAVHARRCLGELRSTEGNIEVAIEQDKAHTWLHVTDTGIGMSRYVLTQVLLDFGKSFWASEALRSEIPGLASSGFKAVGKFGIGFFSVLMLGNTIIVRTRRFNRASDKEADQWVLEFTDGLAHRPILRRPRPSEVLRTTGTRVSVAIKRGVLALLDASRWHPTWDESVVASHLSQRYRKAAVARDAALSASDLAGIVGSLCPTSDVDMSAKVASKEAPILRANDWKTMAQSELLSRIYSASALVTIKGESLVNLTDSDGTLLGRVGYAGPFGFAASTHGGIRNGGIPKLAGAILGHNNSDLVRQHGTAAVPTSAWQDWAARWLEAQKKPSLGALIDLHPLCSARDLAVYLIGTKQLTESALRKWCSGRRELRVFTETLRYEGDFDDVSEGAFDHGLEMTEDIMVLPKTDGALEAIVGVDQIDYLERIRELLRDTWGGFEEFDEDDVCVAIVDGVTEIMRSVVLFERRPVALNS